MEYVTVELHTPALPLPRCTALLVNLARHSWGKGVWRQMDADLFPGTDSLLIVRPLPRVQIADYALPFLSGYRSE